MTGASGSKAIPLLIVSILVGAVLFWDVIPGRIQFKRLCETESGIRIYKRVTLEPEYHGVEFPDNFYIYNQLPIGKRYPERLEDVSDLPGPAKIRRARSLIIDASTGAQLGSLTIFFYGGGWFAQAVSTAPGAGGGWCGDGAGGAAELLNRIFER
jgi:hypothetical protein